jgi:hypothetical protein
MTDALTAQLEETLNICLKQIEDEIEISPAFLSDCAMKRLDAFNRAPVLVKWGCSLQLRQLARGILRGAFDPMSDESKASQSDMFGGLQDKYPCTRNGDRVYVDRMNLTRNERHYNMLRLTKEANTKLQHAEALKAETEILDAQGYFDENGDVKLPASLCSTS